MRNKKTRVNADAVDSDHFLSFHLMRVSPDVADTDEVNVTSHRISVAYHAIAAQILRVPLAVVYDPTQPAQITTHEPGSLTKCSSSISV